VRGSRYMIGRGLKSKTMGRRCRSAKKLGLSGSAETRYTIVRRNNKRRKNFRSRDREASTRNRPKGVDSTRQILAKNKLQQATFTKTFGNIRLLSACRQGGHGKGSCPIQI